MTLDIETTRSEALGLAIKALLKEHKRLSRAAYLEDPRYKVERVKIDQSIAILEQMKKQRSLFK